ncbi:MAG: efflux RND transporter periplasmic adaptor subunit [Cyclobacteriaceae bacterium]
MAKKKKSKNRILYILGGAVVLLLIFAVVGKSQGWVGKKKEISVEIAAAENATIVEKVSASGAVQPVVEVKISPEVSGEVIDLKVEEGDSVSKGDFILKIRPDNFESALQRASANLNQQLANKAQASASEARARANFTRADQEFKRQKNLFDQKVISEADYQLADANFKIAVQDLESAIQSVKAAEYIVQSSRATVSEARENLDLTTITAPMSGIVSKLPIEIGETVLGTSQFQGTEILRIADLSKMEVKVDVNENDIIRISEGDTALIDVDSYSYMDKTFKGIVTQIANTANDKVSSDAVTEFEVLIQILPGSYQDLVLEQGEKYPFKPGMTASVDIMTETRVDVLSVPLSAVTTRSAKEEEEDEGRDRNNNSDDDDEEQDEDEELLEIVFVYEGGKAVQTEVKTGISDFERIEILTGVESGQEVVTGPFLAVSKRLKNGDAVAPPEKKEEPEDSDDN